MAVKHPVPCAGQYNRGYLPCRQGMGLLKQSQAIPCTVASYGKDLGMDQLPVRGTQTDRQICQKLTGRKSERVNCPVRKRWSKLRVEQVLCKCTTILICRAAATATSFCARNSVGHIDLKSYNCRALCVANGCTLEFP